MSVFFRLHQDQSVGTKRSGKWYARAVPMSTINTRQLAEIMQRNSAQMKQVPVPDGLFCLQRYCSYEAFHY